MQEALIAVAVMIIAAILGVFIKPSEAQLQPLSPEQIKGPGHAEEPAHHH
jgi:hypothetical protein